MNKIILGCLFLLPQFLYSQVLYYEYKAKKCGRDCYYALELDTVLKFGRFCSVDCNGCEQGVVYFEAYVRLDKFHNPGEVDMMPYCYSYSKYGRTMSIEYGTENLTFGESHYDFEFIYAFQDDGKRLVSKLYDENSKYRESKFESDMKKLTESSYSLKHFSVTWFPPYMEKVDSIDFSRFPEALREEIEKSSLIYD